MAIPCGDLSILPSPAHSIFPHLPLFRFPFHPVIFPSIHPPHPSSPPISFLPSSFHPLPSLLNFLLSFTLSSLLLSLFSTLFSPPSPSLYSILYPPSQLILFPSLPPLSSFLLSSPLISSHHFNPCSLFSSPLISPSLLSSNPSISSLHSLLLSPTSPYSPSIS